MSSHYAVMKLVAWTQNTKGSWFAKLLCVLTKACDLQRPEIRLILRPASRLLRSLWIDFELIVYGTQDAEIDQSQSNVRRIIDCARSIPATLCNKILR